MKTRIMVTAIGLIALCSWKLQEEKSIKKAKWLNGTWENKTQKGSIYETWSKINEFEYSGRSYIVKEKDTIIFETIRLVQEQGGLFYIPTVKNQNDGSPVRFAAKIISDSALIFENQQHDFPQIISYRKISTDSLVAEISGWENGQERRQIFPMKRM
ncbi:MAG: hypothetical protein I8H66_03965 [Sphingobacteriia bacterium]|nr:hypothetical protein [Sphingobacteriia bacterium]